MESENTAGVEEQTQTTGIEHLGELLQETPEAAGAPQSDAVSGSDDTAPLSKFNDLAGRLGVELDDLYKLEVSQAEDGTPVTIENLKDRYAKQADYDLREIEFEERRVKQEAELMQAQEELREIMAAMPDKAIKPEVLQKVRDKHEAQMQLERKRTLEVIPEWQDEQTRTADIEGIAEHLKQYGYPNDYLARVADHRMIKYFRDNMLREQRIRTALSKVKAGKPNPTTPNKAATKAPQKKPLAGVKRGDAASPLEAIFSQLD